MLSQAGSSEAGRTFGAKWADLVFTAQPDIDIAKEFYADFKDRAARHGRAPDAIRILPGMQPTVVDDEEHSRESWAVEAISREERVRQLEEMLGIPLSQLPQDEPIPPDAIPENSVFNGIRSRAELYHNLIRRRGLTPAQVVEVNPHLTMIGTPEQLADQIVSWFEARACDGFVLFGTSLTQRAAFIDKVIPILQARGLYPDRYPEGRWSARLGLAPLPTEGAA